MSKLLFIAIIVLKGKKFMEIKDLYNLDETIAKPYLEKYKYPWEVLSNIKDII